MNQASCLPSTTISDLKTRSSYDNNVLLSIMNFVKFGLDPGSFATAVMLGDYVDAWGRAHQLLRRPRGGSTYDAGSPYASDGHNPISSMILWASYLPNIIAEDEKAFWNWMGHHGLEGAPVEKIVLVKLQWPIDLYGPLTVPNHVKNTNG